MAKRLSAEDNSLSSSLVSSRVKKFKDIDLTFAKRTNGEIYKKQDAASVKQGIKNVLFTNKFEKPFKPRFGSSINNFLFEIADKNTASEIKENIRTAIETFEPRAKILNLSVIPLEDVNELRVTLLFQVVNTAEKVNFSFTITGLR